MKHTTYKLITGLFFLTLIGCTPYFDYIYFFSETEGFVNIDGNPIKSATVVRTYQVGNYTEEVVEKTTTDENGKFYFPHGKDYRIIKIIGEAVIRQEVIINHNGNKYSGWKYTNRGLEKYPEIGQKIILKCDLKRTVEKKKLTAKNYRPTHYNGLCDIEYNKQLISDGAKNTPQVN